MERDLKALIESPEFGRYHKELHSPVFNPFDVLQVADLEIRHSNVLAWLLRPGETHGIGGRFLRAVVEHLARRHEVASLRSLTGFDDQDNVEITREDYHERLYADITVGFKKERVLLVIENKLEASSPDAEEQVEAYQKAFGEKYTGRYDRIPGVLLTTSSSPEGNDAERGFIHLGWKDVGRIIRSLLGEAKNFADRHVRAFVERYLDVIEEKLIHVGDNLAERLGDDHPRILAVLREDRALLDKVDEPHRATIKRWMEYFEGRPRRLREKVAEYLEVKHRSRAGIRKTGRTDGPGGGWLHWWETPPSGGGLGIGDCAWWWFSFEPHNLTAQLGTPLERNPKNPNWQKIWRFLQKTPVDPGRRERYPMENGVIYRHSLLKDAELSGPFEESVKLLHRRLDQLFGPDGDYERIERYFRCLAFDPRGPQQARAGAGGAGSESG